MSNKKGFFFTLIALFVILLIIFVTTSRSKYRFREKSTAISYRVTTMDNYMRDIKSDLDRAMFIGGYRGILGMQKYIQLKKSFLDDIDTAFYEILINGTANSTDLEVMDPGPQGANLNAWAERIDEEGELINIDFTFIANEVRLNQSSPWSVTILLNATMIIEDNKELASWNTTEIFTKTIGILGFEDPLYTFFSSDKVSNIINKTPSYDFVSESTNDTTVLSRHLNNSYYVNSTSAPSFLMRFIGNFSNSSFGIESMVNLEDFQRQSLSVKNKTIIDYIYFSNYTTNDLCNIQNMPSWFRVTKTKEEFYELDELETEDC